MVLFNGVMLECSNVSTKGGWVPVLSGRMVNLRALELSDIDNCMTWINDREVTRYIIFGTWPISRKAEEEWLNRAVMGNDPQNRVLAIETKDGVYLGNIGLHGIDYISGVAEVGIVIGRKEYWGRGYGTDAMRTLLKHAFENLRLRKVTLRVLGSNERAQKSYRKLGFKEVGRLRNHRLVDGQYEDEVIMEVFAEEFKTSG